MYYSGIFVTMFSRLNDCSVYYWKNDKIHSEGNSVYFGFRLNNNKYWMAHGACPGNV